MVSFIFLGLTVCVWNKATIRFWALVSLAVALSILRVAMTQPKNTAQDISFYNEQKITWRGMVNDYPDRRIDKTYYTLEAREVRIKDVPQAVHGQVLLNAALSPSWSYGDELEITCKLQAPKRQADSNFYYDKYLAAKGIFSLCSFPKIKKIGESNKNFYKYIFDLKDKVGSTINQLWNEPESSLMAGILYGARGGFDKDTTANFSRVGITHIIAVSGANVSIVVMALSGLLILIGFYRQRAFYGILGFLVLFVIFTGASASVIRAAIMGSLVLIEKHIGRPGSGGRVLAVTAAVMVAFNPYVILFDAGFQLSFLATAGIMYIFPMLGGWFEKRFGKLKNPILDYLVNTFFETGSAILMTVPIILYQFGQFSVVAPFMNLAVLWLISPLMFFGFLSVIIGLLSLSLGFLFPFAQIVAGISYVGLTFIIRLTSFLGEKSFAATQVRFPLVAMILCYAVLMIVLYRFYHKKI